MLEQALPVLWSMGALVSPRTTVNAVRDDPDDNRILECAIEAQAQVLISGDHHLLALQEYKSIPIVTPRHFIDLFRGRTPL
jgi:putative PIN family toxin of toxin-antitoxin system